MNQLSAKATYQELCEFVRNEYQKKVMVNKAENVVEQSVGRKLSFNDFIVKNRENPLLVDGIPVFAFAHCGSMGSLNRNGWKSGDLATQKEDWSYIKKYL